MNEHKFSYKWYLKDGYPEKNGLKVFSCFACGGSTMGYKLAGYEVLGANEIDPKMAECYKVNHNPKHLFIEPIQEFKNRNDLPKELFDLDILDGSPPCSSFSMAGNREKDWGKEKKFREGQSEQILDTLFFDFIELAEKLQPKVVVCENVKGLLMGNAKKYVSKIYDEFDKAGYYVHKWLLDASTMGVPQRRERVFFIALRKDLAEKIDEELMSFGLFNPLNFLDMEFDEPEIKFKEIFDGSDVTNTLRNCEKDLIQYKNKNDSGLGDIYRRIKGKEGYFSHVFLKMDDVCPTITANSGGLQIISENERHLNKKELTYIGTYPIDYEYLESKYRYIIGMAVPPVMVAQIATRLKEQIFDKIKE